MIPLEECKHGWLYRIDARNFSFGVFNEDSKGFIGVRYKFGHEYLFTEFHWDTGAPFGTVCPQECLEECPIKDLSEDHKRVATAKDVSKYIEEGEEIFEVNQTLFGWLKEKTKERASDSP